MIYKQFTSRGPKMSPQEQDLDYCHLCSDSEVNAKTISEAASFHTPANEELYLCGVSIPPC